MLLIFLVVFIGMIGGLLMLYSTEIPDTVTSGQMQSILAEYGLEPADATANADDSMLQAGLKTCLIAAKDDLRIEFYSFDNQDAALKVYREAYKQIITTKMAAPRIQIRTGKFNYKFYSLDADGTYSVVVYVKNTAVYAYCNSENKQFLNDILFEMGYISAEKQ